MYYYTLLWWHVSVSNPVYAVSIIYAILYCIMFIVNVEISGARGGGKEIQGENPGVPPVLIY